MRRAIDHHQAGEAGDDVRFSVQLRPFRLEVSVHPVPAAVFIVAAALVGIGTQI